MRPSPYRWIPVILIALILLFWLSTDLLPRFVGGLLGQGDRNLGPWSQAGRELPEILWDTSDPRDLEAAPIREEPPDPSPIDDPPAPPEPATEEFTETPPSSETGRGSDAENAVPEAAGAASGEGTGEGQRRAARLLYQEWPRESILRELERGGSFRFRLRVEADGRVSDWELLESYDCEACAAEAERIVRSLRFRPALEQGRAAACWVPFEIRFFAPGEG